MFVQKYSAKTFQTWKHHKILLQYNKSYCLSSHVYSGHFFKTREDIVYGIASRAVVERKDGISERLVPFSVKSLHSVRGAGDRAGRSRRAVAVVSHGDAV